MSWKRRGASVLARVKLARKAWKTNKKIVVIESDDWGAIRTSSVGAHQTLSKKGYVVKDSPYMLDTLEADEDLCALYDVLVRVRDSNGNHPVVTANMIMGNPDFDRIEDEGFVQYFFEPVQETLDRYPRRGEVERLWKEGYEQSLFYPQLHGREHIVYWEWLDQLRNKNEEAVETFKLGMCGVPLNVSKFNLSFYKPIYIDRAELETHGVDLESLIKEGSELFKETFGYRSKTTVAPNVAWTSQAEEAWSKCGITGIQGGFLQEVHTSNGVDYISHYLGETNAHGMRYSVRNCTFEPCRNYDDAYWKNTMRQVRRAFLLNTPAIISTHRVNYVGSISQDNRTRGLTQLSALLREIVNSYPDVIFMSSADLGGCLF